MANTQATFGFKHIGYLGGGAPDYQQSRYALQSTNATKIGFGDPVIKVNATSNYIGQATGASITSTVPLLGIFAGCEFIPSGGVGLPQWSPYWPGSTASDGVAYVIDAPNALYLVAALSTAITTANIGQTVNFTTGTPQTTGGGYSVATVDQSTATSSNNATSQANPFKIVQLYQGIGNGSDPTTAFNWVVVTPNNQVFKTLAGF